MNIKSLLLGSAAALAAMSIAYAAPSPAEGAGTTSHDIFYGIGVDIGAQASLGTEVGLTAALEDPGPKMDKLASIETGIIEPDAGSIFHIAGLPQGGLIIEHEGVGGMKSPIVKEDIIFWKTTTI